MELSEEKALGIIEQMIHSVQEELHDNGFYFMLWGYLVFVSAIIDYALLIQENAQHALVWAILMPLGGLISYVYGRKQIREKRVTTYIDEVLRHLMIAYGISLFTVCLIMPMTGNNWRSFFPTLMIIYAFGLYATGGIIKYMPLQAGAVLVWALAALCYFLTYDWQLICLASGVLGGFIIPGHMLNNRYKMHV